jgi:hypothetical protein
VKQKEKVLIGAPPSGQPGISSRSTQGIKHQLLTYRYPICFFPLVFFRFRILEMLETSLWKVA